MISLRFKFTLALLITSLLVIGTVGIIAHQLVLNRFSQISMEQSFERFQADIAAYIIQYGSWEQAQQVESFGQFERRRRTMVGAAARQDLAEASTELPQLNPEVPPPVLDEAGRPPFRFILLDRDGVVLLGADTYNAGEIAPPELLSQAKTILYNQKVIARAVPVGEPNLNDIDQGYMQAIQGALSYALITACFLAIVIGLFLSSWLTQPLRSLSKAIRAMKAGDLHQEVKVETHDEIGTLLKNFNQMSKDLAKAYADLEKSNLTIREQAEHLKEISIHDELTQLHNRRYFNEQAEKMFAHAQRHDHPLVFMIGDIDHFKQINDRFSHAAGDEVLRKIGEILVNNVRKNDLVARYGGEEFVIAFPETPIDQAVSLSERLRELIEQYPWKEIHRDLQVTMSMGLNSDTQLGTFEQMLSVADAKLYKAKHAGRNKICY